MPIMRPSSCEIRISLLGGFSVAVAGQPVPDRWRLRKAKTLVKLLALAPGHRLHRDIVVDRLWPDAEPQAAANNLYQVVHTIRRMMGAGSIALVDDVVRLCPAGGLTRRCRPVRASRRTARNSNDIAALQHALRLWTGPLLPEDLYADWADEHRDRLTEPMPPWRRCSARSCPSKANGSRPGPVGTTRIRPAPRRTPPPGLDRGTRRPRPTLGSHRGLRAVARRPGRGVRRRTRTSDQGPLPTAAHRQQPCSMPAYAPPALQPARGATARNGSNCCSAWQRASAGESHLFLISGEAGIGKTRLAEELLAWADQQGIATARARSYSAEGRLALAPVTEWLRSDAIRQSLGQLADVWLTETARLLPELLDERPHVAAT